MGIGEKMTIPMNDRNRDHFLLIADVYVFMVKEGALEIFEVEPQDPFKPNKNELMTLREVFKEAKSDLHFKPDIYARWQGRSFLIEVQRTGLSKARWHNKHALRELYFKGGYFKEASWQRHRKKDEFQKPNIVIWSKQSADQVSHGATMQVIAVNDLQELRAWVDSRPKR